MLGRHSWRREKGEGEGECDAKVRNRDTGISRGGRYSRSASSKWQCRRAQKCEKLRVMKIGVLCREQQRRRGKYTAHSTVFGTCAMCYVEIQERATEREMKAKATPEMFVHPLRGSPGLWPISVP